MVNHLLDAVTEMFDTRAMIVCFMMENVFRSNIVQPRGRSKYFSVTIYQFIVGGPQNVDNVVNVVNVQWVVSSSGNQDILANTSRHTRASAARVGRTNVFYSVLYFVLDFKF